MADVLRHFLSAVEVAALRALGETPTGWTAGRQGTGYDILAVRDILAATPEAPIGRALARLGTPFEDRWDAYLIRYRAGAHVPDHVDVAELGRRHRRLNALVTQPTSGGELYLDDRLVALALGDAIVFDPDREVHRVTPVTGTRLVFSVGAWI